MKSVDWQHGTGMGLIMPAPTAHSVTQVRYYVMLAKYNERHQPVNVRISKDIKETNHIFSSVG